MLCDYRALLQADPYLEKYQDKLASRAKLLQTALDLLPDDEELVGVADAHQYYGFHQVAGGWVFRTCAPAAQSVALVGDFNRWDEESCQMEALPGGNWEVMLPWGALHHGQRAVVKLRTRQGPLWRVPATSRRVWRNPHSGEAAGRVWCPAEPFPWTDAGFSPARAARFIYECHPGACGGKGDFEEVERHVLPYMQRLGYNTLLLMGVVEHADPASWGECAGHLFAPTARMGTPEALKRLVDTAHRMGLQ